MAQIKVKVVKWGTTLYPTGCVKSIECTEATTNRHVWYTPQSNAQGVFIGYKETSGSLSKPTADSFKVVEMRVNNTNIAVVVADSETDATFNANCNICCGDAPVDMSTNAVPLFALEAQICPNAAGNKVVSRAYPLSGAIKVLASFSGAPPATAPLASYANAAAFVTWANTNWSAMGTWSNDAVNSIISCTLGAGVTSAGFLVYQ